MTGLRFGGAEDRSDAAAFLGRVARLDPGTLVRLRASGPKVTCWAWLPLDVLAARSIGGVVDPADVTVTAKALLDVVEDSGAGDAALFRLPQRRDENWRGALPADGRSELLDEIPADVVASLLTATERTFREASAGADPQSVADALLDQEVLTVSGGPHTVAIPLRALLACARMGFLGPSPIRIAVAGGWVRVGAGFGAVYLRRGDRLALFPAGR